MERSLNAFLKENQKWVHVFIKCSGYATANGLDSKKMRSLAVLHKVFRSFKHCESEKLIYFIKTLLELEQ